MKHSAEKIKQLFAGRKNRRKTIAALAAAVILLFLAGIAITESRIHLAPAEAEQIALNHAGLNKDDISFLSAHLDKEFIKSAYEINFFSGMTEYEYEIDAATGRLIDFDMDRD